MSSDKKSYRAMILFFTAAVIMVGLIIFIPPLFDIDNYSKDKYIYNYFEFEKIDGIWTSRTQEGADLFLISLRHGPLDVEDIPVRGDLLNFRKNNNFFYITFDPTAENHDSYVTMSNAEISPNMVLHFRKTIEAACVIDHPDCTGISTVTCSSTDQPVIHIKKAAEPSVELAGNCVTISGTGVDLVKATDRFMYGMYGIMK